MTSEPEEVIVDTLGYGNIVIERSENTVSARLESDESLVVTIERDGPRTRSKIPIGTRDSSHLALRVNDRCAALTLGAGRLLKRSYRIAVEIDGRFLSLRARDLETSVFQNGKVHQTDQEFGELVARADGTVEVMWATPGKVTVLNKSLEFQPPEPTVEDLLICFVCAAAFGTGGLSLTGIVGALIAAVPF